MGGVLKMVVFGLVFAAVSLRGKWAGAQMHHVVGGDRGWDASHDVASWASGRTFGVGDKIWFAYSAAQGSVAELGSRKEYEACDVSNPIRMYTDGLDSISLEAEGLRYFVSSNAEHCKNGLKLHVEVLPYNYSGPGILQVTASDEHQTVLAAGPTPSGSAHLSSSLLLFAFGFLCVLMTSS